MGVKRIACLLCLKVMPALILQNAAFTDTRTHLIPVKDSAQFGSIRVTTVSEKPNLLIANCNCWITLQCCQADQLQILLGYSGGSMRHTCSCERCTPGCGYSNLNQLSMWGIVYSEAAGTGFAMEFIGDMHDSLDSCLDCK